MKQITATSLAIAGFILCCIASHSCANTTTAPSGGPKDTLAPVLLKLTPGNNSTGFPITGGEILLLYDEYTVIKNSNDIFLSPPTKKRPSAKVKGKNIVVSFQDTLMPDRTYTIDFGQAFADNNEGNPAPRLVYTFSTGDSIDSLYFTGRITDSQTLLPVKGTMVAIYSDLSDSACFNKLPDAAVKTDDWGFFSIRNIKDTAYRVYAYTDSDNDYKYNPDSDQIAFLDSVFTPHAFVSDTTYELGVFDMKDTLACQAREAMVSLKLFKELQSVQYLQNSGRSSEKTGFLKFSASNVNITDLNFPGIADSCIILQYNRTRDSLDFWINTDYRLDDSLLVNLTYMKTDSTGVLSPFTERLALAVPAEVKSAAAEKEKNQPDTVFTLSLSVSDDTVEENGIIISSVLPAITHIRDSIHLYETNPKGQVEEKTFTFEQDSLDIRKFIVKPADKLTKGYDYELAIGQGAFTNLDKLPSTAASAKFKIPQSEELSTLILNLSGVETTYIVELTGEKMDSALRTYTVNSDRNITIPYLKQGSYAIRITRDSNHNGYLDTGNLLEKRQPEEVRFYETTPGNRLLEIPSSSEVEQDIDLNSLFL